MSTISVVIGRCKSGKSSLVRALTEGLVEKGTRVFIVRNASVRCDWIDDSFSITPDKFKSLSSMLKFVEQLTKMDGKKVIIFEDALSMFRKKELEEILRMMSIHRHTQTSFLIVTQTFKSLPNSIRSGEISDDCTIYLSKQGRAEVLKSIYQELPQFESLEELKEMNRELEQYQFICIEKDEAYPIGFELSNFEVRGGVRRK